MPWRDSVGLDKPERTSTIFEKNLIAKKGIGTALGWEGFLMDPIGLIVTLQYFYLLKVEPMCDIWGLRNCVYYVSSCSLRKGLSVNLELTNWLSWSRSPHTMQGNDRRLAF